MQLKQCITVGLIAILGISDFPVMAAEPVAKTSPAPAPEASTTAATTKDPMIEVSVDSLEISENNADILGVLWGQPGQVNNGVVSLDANHLNFLETTPTPAVFDIGKFNRAGLFAQFHALIQSNQVRILANPTLLTKSGFEANFLVGGEIPYPTVGQGGVTGVEFKKYGVALKILPQITPRQTIEAQINVGVSNPDSSVAIQISGINVPGLAAREAGSKVEVKDGETVVLAGIKQSRRSKIVTKIPILGSIPLLGLLFRHKDEEVVQTSLVFFVTFRLIK